MPLDENPDPKQDDKTYDLYTGEKNLGPRLVDSISVDTHVDKEWVVLSGRVRVPATTLILPVGSWAISFAHLSRLYVVFRRILRRAGFNLDDLDRTADEQVAKELEEGKQSS